MCLEKTSCYLAATFIATNHAHISHWNGIWKQKQKQTKTKKPKKKTLFGNFSKPAAATTTTTNVKAILNID